MPEAVGRSTEYAKLSCIHAIITRGEAYEPLLTHAEATETFGVVVRPGLDPYRRSCTELRFRTPNIPS